MTHVTVRKPITENPSSRENLRTPQIEIAQFNEFKRRKGCINSREGHEQLGWKKQI